MDQSRLSIFSMRQIFHSSLGGHLDILPRIGRFSQLLVNSNNRVLALPNLAYTQVVDNTRNDRHCKLQLVLAFEVVV